MLGEPDVSIAINLLFGNITAVYVRSSFGPLYARILSGLRSTVRMLRPPITYPSSIMW